MSCPASLEILSITAYPQGSVEFALPFFATYRPDGSQILDLAPSEVTIKDDDAAIPLLLSHAGRKGPAYKAQPVSDVAGRSVTNTITYTYVARSATYQQFLQQMARLTADTWDLLVTTISGHHYWIRAVQPDGRAAEDITYTREDATYNVTITINNTNGALLTNYA